MKKKLWIGAAALAALAGCTTTTLRLPDEANPQVFVVGGRVLVDQEPLLVSPGRAITWHLPQGGAVRFSAQPINLQPEKDLPEAREKDPRPFEEKRRDIACQAPTEDGHAVSCATRFELLFRAGVPRHYSITVEDRSSGSPKTIILDPSMIPR